VTKKKRTTEQQIFFSSPLLPAAAFSILRSLWPTFLIVRADSGLIFAQPTRMLLLVLSPTCAHHSWVRPLPRALLLTLVLKIILVLSAMDKAVFARAPSAT